MWTDPTNSELKERLAKMSDEELLKMVGEDRADYREEALQLVKTELAERGILWQGTQGAPIENYSAFADEAIRSVARFDMLCNICGSKMRPGFLHSKFEVTISFVDTGEERFLEVLACSRCGQVKMRVDYQTDVAD